MYSITSSEHGKPQFSVDTCEFRHNATELWTSGLASFCQHRFQPVSTGLAETDFCQCNVFTSSYVQWQISSFVIVWFVEMLLLTNFKRE